MPQPVIDVKYTQVAAQAASLADLFEGRFSKGLEGPVRHRVELAAPDGPSTGSGKQALQHIKLIPDDGGPTIVVGWCHTVKRNAEIRMYSRLAELHAQRFQGAPIPLDARNYRTLAQDLASFFTSLKFKVTFAEEGVGPAPKNPPAPPERRWAWIILAAVLTTLVVAAAIVVPRLLQR